MILAVKIRLFRLSPIIFLKKLLCKDEFSTRLLTFVPELAIGCWLLALHSSLGACDASNLKNY